jgi:hypothetical protein
MSGLPPIATTEAPSVLRTSSEPDHPAKRIHELLLWNWQPQRVAHAARAQGFIRPSRPDQGPPPDAYGEPWVAISQVHSDPDENSRVSSLLSEWVLLRDLNSQVFPESDFKNTGVLLGLIPIEIASIRMKGSACILATTEKVRCRCRDSKIRRIDFEEPASPTTCPGAVHYVARGPDTLSKIIGATSADKGSALTKPCTASVSDGAPFRDLRRSHRQRGR